MPVNGDKTLTILKGKYDAYRRVAKWVDEVQGHSMNNVTEDPAQFLKGHTEKVFKMAHGNDARSARGASYEVLLGITMLGYGVKPDLIVHQYRPNDAEGVDLDYYVQIPKRGKTKHILISCKTSYRERWKTAFAELYYTRKYLIERKEDPVSPDSIVTVGVFYKEFSKDGIPETAKRIGTLEKYCSREVDYWVSPCEPHGFNKFFRDHLK